ncbi:MAG: helix-hairpin-helix domain-containing protein [Chitinophagaceae bacterium]|nr:helix-hairpin-helix domain-containing protein [Chitinophagaceae bacterium]
MPATRNTLLKDYFTFSKKERRAVILLAVLAIIFSLLPTLFPVLVKGESDFIVDEETQQQLAAMRTNEKEAAAKEDDEQNGDWYQPKSKSYPQYSSGEKGELFFFDPNNASAEEWKRLGVKDKTIQTILKFRSKGGSFKKPEDISRIYGLSVKDIDRLLPFVKIEKEQPVTTTNNSEQTTVSTTESKPVFSEKRSKPIDINTADTAEWKSLKGIGSFYAKKIVGFRDKLGGFYSVQQVAETFGLPDSTFQTIKPFLLVNTSAVKQINLNTATAEELKAHPYIKGTIANAIINYRTNHGNFSSVEQLQNIGAIDEDLYRKIAPYLTIK